MPKSTYELYSSSFKLNHLDTEISQPLDVLSCLLLLFSLILILLLRYLLLQRNISPSWLHAWVLLVKAHFLLINSPLALIRIVRLNSHTLIYWNLLSLWLTRKLLRYETKRAAQSLFIALTKEKILFFYLFGFLESFFTHGFSSI